MLVNINLTNASGAHYRGKADVTSCVQRALKAHKVKMATIDIILVNDKDIRKLNKQYLNHDYTTDVITFPLEQEPLLGEIYISLDTAKRQALQYRVSTINELCRLAVHGTLHLLGHNDATDEERVAMQKLENRYLSRL